MIKKVHDGPTAKAIGCENLNILRIFRLIQPDI